LATKVRLVYDALQQSNETEFLNMHAFTTDVSALPNTNGLASVARSILNAFLVNERRAKVPAAPAPAAIDEAVEATSRTVPNLASATSYMAWLS
jgi:hypothetical protein